MNMDVLKQTAEAMVMSGQGILAMDESHPTCQKRFEKLGIEVSEESRRAYRDMLMTAKGLGDYIAGAILFDETLRQKTLDGIGFPQYLEQADIIPGIKVDKGVKPLAMCPNEKITEGLDGLRERLEEYKRMGARFAKWRAVITIDADNPSDTCIYTNAQALARYAALCQEADIVPIVEPEVLMDGEHTIERCYAVTKHTQHIVFQELTQQRVELSGIVLKPNMIVSGTLCKHQATSDKVAELTLQCLRDTVPESVSGIAFLSGGMSDKEASANLNAINRLAQQTGGVPWCITFSYGRALQQQAMKTWNGDKMNVDSAQATLLKRARMNGAASTGSYTKEMEDAIQLD